MEGIKGWRLHARRLARDRLFSDLWLDVRAGEVTGVIGLESEAKAALAEILCGGRAADGGELIWEGERLAANEATARLRAAVGYVGPREMLAECLSIADHLFVLGRKRCGRGLSSFFVHEAENNERSLEYLALAQIDVPPETLTGQLTHDQKHRLEFLRALLGGARMVVLDSPLRRSDLVSDEGAFRTLLDYARASGVAVVMLFSNVDRLMRLCDRAVVVRGGCTVARTERKDFDRARLLRQIDGQKALSHCARESRAQCGSPLELYVVRTAEGNLNGFSLRLQAGAVVGLVCRDDAWNGWFVEFLQGAHPEYEGVVLRSGRVAESALLRHVCTRQNPACFIVRGDDMGLLTHLSVIDNLLIPIQSRIGGPLRTIGDDVRLFARRRCVEGGIVDCEEDAELPVSVLPAARRFRVWMERARLFHPDLCVLLGLQEEADPELRWLLQRFCDEHAAAGAAVLLVSSQKWPMAHIADRLFLVEDGVIAREIESSSP